jgi:hypothetical protein
VADMINQPSPIQYAERHCPRSGFGSTPIWNVGLIFESAPMPDRSPIFRLRTIAEPGYFAKAGTVDGKIALLIFGSKEAATKFIVGRAMEREWEADHHFEIARRPRSSFRIPHFKLLPQASGLRG